MNYKMLIGLCVTSLFTVGAFTQVRTTSLNCKGEDSKLNSVKVIIKKTVTLGATPGVRVDFSISAEGTIDDQSGEISGSSFVNVSPQVVNPNSPEFSVADQNGNSASIVSLGKLAEDSELPGRVVTVRVETQNELIPLLYIKGVIGNYSAGTKNKKMNTNIFVSNGIKQQKIGNLDLSCDYSLAE